MLRREFLQQVGVGIGGLTVVEEAVLNAASQQAKHDVAPAKLLSPVPYQVFQRRDYEAQRAHEHEPGGPKLGYADLPIEGDFADVAGSTWQYRIVVLPHAFGQAIDWTAFEPKFVNYRFTASIRLPAGGWYRLEIQALLEGTAKLQAAVEPVGVGEVFVVAGQSYAEGANDELIKVDDPAGRVAAYDVVKKTWRVAHDPQPNVNTGGTIWPPLGDLLVPLLRTPVGFVNVAVGGTASRQWLPGEALFQNLAEAGRQISKFRAVLWQQGESDVIERIPTEKYVAHLVAIRAELAKIWAFSPPWLLAKSTLHPTVYNRPEEEGWIRTAVDELCTKTGFHPGPDTDILGGENRGGLGTRRHFTGVGQRRAALLWFAAIWRQLHFSTPDNK